MGFVTGNAKLDKFFYECRRAVDKTINGFLEPMVLRKLQKVSRPARAITTASVHMQLSKSTLSMGLLSLRSLEAATERSWPIFIHDDGSMGEEEIKTLKGYFPDIRVLLRKDVDEDSIARIGPYEHVARMRRKFVYGVKFTDPHYYAPTPNFILLDSDVVFYKRPDVLMDWAENQRDACHFNQDPGECYCVDTEDIQPLYSFPIWRNVNAGLLLLRREALDLEVAEKFLANLAKTISPKRYFVMEQTMQAVMMSAYGKGGPLDWEYRVLWDCYAPKGVVSGHYVGEGKWRRIFFDAIRKLRF